MILDSIKNSDRYNSLHPLFSKAFEYIRSLDFSNLETGKTEIQGRDLFVSISESNLNNEEDAKLEVHNKYIDIQIPVSKPEGFGWISRKDMKNPKDGFNTEKDVQFFSDKPESYFDVCPGSFVIFFPEDGHAPCIGQGSVLKIVVKVLVKE